MAQHPAAVIRNNDKKFRSFKSKENIHMKENSKFDVEKQFGTAQDLNIKNMIIKLTCYIQNKLFAYAKTKAQISCTITDQCLRIVQSLYFLNLNFQASSFLLWLDSWVCVGPGWKAQGQIFS